MWPWFFTIPTRKQTFKESLCTPEAHTALSQAVCPRPSISNLASFHFLPHQKEVSEQAGGLLTLPPLRDLCFSVREFALK